MKKILLVLLISCTLFGCATPEHLRKVEEAREMLLETYVYNTDLISIVILEAWRAEAKNHVDYLTDLSIEYHTNEDGTILQEKYNEIIQVQKQKLTEIDVQFNEALAVMEDAKGDLRDLIELSNKIKELYDETGEVSQELYALSEQLVIRIRARYEALKEMMEDAIR